jgi:hypothetical protein
VVDNRGFRDLLVFVGAGTCTEEDIPHRTKLTDDIIKAWGEERKAFADDMKVCSIRCHLVCRNLCILMSCDSMPLGGFRSQRMLGVLRALHHSSV